ncbi:MAG: hypothetical protein ACYTHJ_10030 [Planctomycetota bacterium]|jgi:hypothetical protein
MATMIGKLILVTMLLAPGHQTANQLLSQDYELDELLIYYGWPSAINQTFSVSLASLEFAQYDYVILGDGIQDGPDDPNPHPDHQNTVEILAHPFTGNTRFFGYIDLGVITQNLSLEEIQRRIDAWKEMGINGIFLDDYGYDFGVTRERQNAAVVYAHFRGLPVIANGFFVDDVFSEEVHPNNPRGLATSLRPSDFYLFESHQVRIGSIVSAQTWYTKADQLKAYQDDIGFGILSITTNDAINTYDQAEFNYAWYSAALFGHVATGWGEYLFSSSGEFNTLAPYRQRPNINLGILFTSDVEESCTTYQRSTDFGTIFVDTWSHTGVFQAD